MKTSALVKFPIYLSNINVYQTNALCSTRLFLKTRSIFLLKHFEKIGSEVGGDLHLPINNQFFLEHLLYLPWGFEHLDLDAYDHKSEHDTTIVRIS